MSLTLIYSLNNENFFSFYVQCMHTYMKGWNDSRGIFDSTCLYEIISYECDISYVHITMEPVYNTLMNTKKLMHDSAN